jgi:hypothetical protein
MLLKPSHKKISYNIGCIHVSYLLALSDTMYGTLMQTGRLNGVRSSDLLGIGFIIFFVVI